MFSVRYYANRLFALLRAQRFCLIAQNAFLYSILSCRHTFIRGFVRPSVRLSINPLVHCSVGNGANIAILPGMMQRLYQNMCDHVRARRQGTASTTRPQLDNNEECLLYSVSYYVFLVACTWLYNPLWPSVCWSVTLRSRLAFFRRPRPPVGD